MPWLLNEDQLYINFPLFEGIAKMLVSNLLSELGVDWDQSKILDLLNEEDARRVLNIPLNV